MKNIFISFILWCSLIIFITGTPYFFGTLAVGYSFSVFGTWVIGMVSLFIVTILLIIFIAITWAIFSRR
jgi:hypothetical protein